MATKAQRKPASAIRCIECEKRGDDRSFAEMDAIWKAPVGIDPRMHRFMCTKGHFCYKVLGEKEEQNLVEFLENNKTL